MCLRYDMTKELLLVLVGGICSALGGFAAIWYQAKKAGQIRREEVRAEQGLEACKKALALSEQLWTFSISRSTDDTLKLLADNGEWFSINQLLLPHKFVENLISIRLAMSNIQDYESDLKRISGQEKMSDIAREISKNKTFIRKLINEMETVIRKELGSKEIKIRTPENENKQ